MTQLCYILSVITFVLDIWLQNQLQSLMAVRFVEEEKLKLMQSARWAKFVFKHTEHCFRVSFDYRHSPTICLSSVPSILNIVHYR